MLWALIPGVMLGAGVSLQEELTHGERVCTGILAGAGRPTDWHRLFEPDSFFQRFKNYLQARPSPADAAGIDLTLITAAHNRAPAANSAAPLRLVPSVKAKE